MGALLRGGKRENIEPSWRKWITEGWVFRLSSPSHFLFTLCFLNGDAVRSAVSSSCLYVFPAMTDCALLNCEPKQTFSLHKSIASSNALQETDENRACLQRVNNEQNWELRKWKKGQKRTFWNLGLVLESHCDWLIEVTYVSLHGVWQSTQQCNSHCKQESKIQMPLQDVLRANVCPQPQVITFFLSALPYLGSSYLKSHLFVVCVYVCAMPHIIWRSENTFGSQFSLHSADTRGPTEMHRLHSKCLLPGEPSQPAIGIFDFSRITSLEVGYDSESSQIILCVVEPILWFK